MGSVRPLDVIVGLFIGAIVRKAFYLFWQRTLCQHTHRIDTFTCPHTLAHPLGIIVSVSVAYVCPTAADIAPRDYTSFADLPPPFMSV